MRSNFALASCAPAGARRAETSLSQPSASAEPTTRPTASQPTTAAALTPVNSVVTTSVPDSKSRTPTITPATTLSHRVLVHGPSTSGSLHSNSRNTLALGSSTLASACTAVVSNPSGAPGISTIAAASTTIAV